MGLARAKLCRPSTALLCVGLVINNLLIQSGCTTFAPLAIDGHIYREIDGTDPIQKVLKNTPLAGATSLDFDPRSGRLVLEYPYGTRKVEATIGSLGFDPRVTSLVITWGTRWTQIELDTERRLTSLRTSSGLTFQLTNFRGRRPSASSVGIDPFFAANAELLEYVHLLDRDQSNGGTPLPPSSGTPTGGVQPPIEIKPTAAALENPLISILAFLGSVLGVQVVLAGAPNLFYILAWLFQATLAVEVINGLLAGSAPPEAALAQGFLQLRNQLLGETPVWAVFMILADGTRSEDLLAGQAIPAGSSRDFALAPGQYDVAIWVPASEECFREYEHADVVIHSHVLTEIVVAAGAESRVVPEGCLGG